jgi:hypothetical protein
MLSLALALAGMIPPAARAAPDPRPPAIPVHGAYLGAWVNPNGVGHPATGEEATKEIGQLADFNASIGARLAILHAFSGFSEPLPVMSLAAIERNGSTPLLDWGCGNLAEINAGTDDKMIDTYAKGVRAFGRPLFLRWYWEMNIGSERHKKCGAFGEGPAFVAAWRRIRTIFKADGATNAAFVWCPSGHGDVTPYYPGDAYVDWVGADKFDHRGHGEAAFAGMFGPFLAKLPSHGKPIMIGATGAMQGDQAAFIRGIAKDAPTKFPQIKAVNYFDAKGKLGDWRLQGDGLAAFKTLAANPYFSFRDTH